MKKLLLGSAVLLLFATSILIFQLSCTKEAEAETTETPAQHNKIVYLSKHGNGPEIWIANYDGSNKTKVNYTLPSGEIDFAYGVKLSPDGKKLFFSASEYGNGENAYGIFSCNVEGGAATKIISAANATDSLNVGGAY